MSIRRLTALLSLGAALAAPLAAHAGYNPFNNQDDRVPVSTKTRAEVRAELLAWQQTHRTQDTWIDPRDAAPAATQPEGVMAAMDMPGEGLATTPTGYPPLHAH